MKRWIIFLAALLGVLLACPCHALELPDEVTAVLEEAPPWTEELRQMELGGLLDELLAQWKAQAARPLHLLAQTVLFLLMGAAAVSLAPAQHWRDSLETIVLMGAFLLVSQPILNLMDSVARTVQEWYQYLISFIPVFSGVMLSCGQSGGAMVYSGMFLTMAGFSAQLIGTAALPLLRVYLALCAAAALCGLEGAPDACEMIVKGVRWLLRLLSMLFGTVLGLQTMLAQGTDNLALKTGRFVLSGVVPVVGSAASEAMGSVLAALRVVKGSLGLAAVAVLGAAFVPLLIQCAAYALTVTGTALAAKLCGLKRGGEMLESIAHSVSLCISFLVFFFMLVVLSTALMILTGSGG